MKPLRKNPSLKKNSYSYRVLLSTVAVLLLLVTGTAQTTIQITEVYADNAFKLKNTTNNTIDISSYWICNFPLYEQLGTLNISCGDLRIAGGEEVVFTIADFFGPNEGELGLYTTNNFANSTAILSYVEWGMTGHERSSVAMAKGIWDGDNAPTFSNGRSIAVNGAGTKAADWFINNQPQICGNNCLALVEVNSTSILSGSYQASDRITSMGTVAANSTVVFDATTEITLSPNFSVAIGATFEAKIGGCATTFKENSLLPEE